MIAGGSQTVSLFDDIKKYQRQEAYTTEEKMESEVKEYYTSNKPFVRRASFNSPKNIPNVPKKFYMIFSKEMYH